MYGLELFAGERSFSTEALKWLPTGSRILSLDWKAPQTPSEDYLTLRLSDWKHLKEWPPGTPPWWERRFGANPANAFDFVWASPPCTWYSRARTTGKASQRGSREHEMQMVLADRMVIKAREIIGALKPRHFFLENPRGGLQNRACMADIRHWKRDLSYCQYGTAFRKDEQLWTNLAVDLRRCSVRHPCPSLAGRLEKGLSGHSVTAQAGPSGSGQPGSKTAAAVNGIPTALTKVLVRRMLNPRHLGDDLTEETSTDGHGEVYVAEGAVMREPVT